MNRKKILIASAFVFIAAIFAGVYILFNEIFPKAENIRLPEGRDVISVSVGVNNDEAFEINNVDLAKLLELLGGAKPTRELCLNDTPNVRPFYKIALRTSETEYRYFIYEDNSVKYIEMPYKGIYTADDEIFNYVLKLCEERS